MEDAEDAGDETEAAGVEDEVVKFEMAPRNTPYYVVVWPQNICTVHFKAWLPVYFRFLLPFLPVCRVVAGEYDEGYTISGEHIKRALMCAETRASEREVDEMLKELDLDGDGKVGFWDLLRQNIGEL